jgi:hypothetical protein
MEREGRSLHHSPFTIHHSLLTTCYSLFAIRHSPFAIPSLIRRDCFVTDALLGMESGFGQQ